MDMKQRGQDELLIESDDTNFVFIFIMFVLGIAGFVGYFVFISDDNISSGERTFNLAIGVFMLVVVGMLLSQMFSAPMKSRIVINRHRQSVFIDSTYVLGFKKTYHNRVKELYMNVTSDRDSYDNEYYSLEFTLNDHSVSCSIDSREEGQQTIDHIHRFISNQAR